MISLAIDTSTKNCSVGLFNGDSLIDSINFEGDGYVHSEKLFDFISDLCSKNQISTSSIKHFFISNGPGSYTGLRIGASAIKGMAYANKGKVYCLSSLEVLFWQGLQEAKELDCSFIASMIDARRDEVYLGFYDLSGNLIEEEKAVIIDENFFDRFTDRVLLVGDGTPKFHERFNHLSNYHWSKETINKVNSLGSIIEKRIKENSHDDLAYFEPNYIKSYQPGKKKKLFS